MRNTKITIPQDIVDILADEQTVHIYRQLLDSASKDPDFSPESYKPQLKLFKFFYYTNLVLNMEGGEDAY